jgi:FkbM family methyltransferase
MFKSLSWMLYRRFRIAWYSLLRRNPLCSKPNRLNWQEEWDAVKGLRRARRELPQLAETDQQGRERWITPAGAFWIPSGSDRYFVGMLTAEILSCVYHTAARPLDSDSVVMDCGANVGFFSRFALDRGARLVVAFEPSTQNVECLRRNLAQEIAEGRALVIQKGLWDRDAILSFFTGNKRNPGSHHIVDGAMGDSNIEVTTIDNVVQQHRLPSVNFIKMDIEGSELRAIQGGSRTIARDRPVCFIATEHTTDLFRNAASVIESMRAIDPRYRYRCTELHPYDSPSRGRVLTPYTLVFQSP